MGNIAKYRSHAQTRLEDEPREPRPCTEVVELSLHWRCGYTSCGGLVNRSLSRVAWSCSSSPIPHRPQQTTPIIFRQIKSCRLQSLRGAQSRADPNTFSFSAVNLRRSILFVLASGMKRPNIIRSFKPTSRVSITNLVQRTPRQTLIILNTLGSFSTSECLLL